MHPRQISIPPILFAKVVLSNWLGNDFAALAHSDYTVFQFERTFGPVGVLAEIGGSSNRSRDSEENARIVLMILNTHAKYDLVCFVENVYVYAYLRSLLLKLAPIRI